MMIRIFIDQVMIISVLSNLLRVIIQYSRNTRNTYSLISHEWCVLIIKFLWWDSPFMWEKTFIVLWEYWIIFQLTNTIVVPLISFAYSKQHPHIWGIFWKVGQLGNPKFGCALFFIYEVFEFNKNLILFKLSEFFFSSKAAINWRLKNYKNKW